MYTIGQVAKFLGMSRDTLKFYEEKGLVRPVQDQENGYRHYSEFDIWDVITTNFYRELDFEVKKIQEIRQNKSASEVQMLLVEKERQLKEEISYKQQLVRKIKNLQKGCEDIKAYLGHYTVREMSPLIVKGELSDLLAYEEYEVIKAHGESIKPAVTLSEGRRILYFNETGVIGTRCVVVNRLMPGEEAEGEILAHPKCVYTIAEEGRGTGSTEDITPSMQRFFAKVAEETHYESLGILYINILMTTYDKGLEKRYLEIYAPIKE